MTPAQFLDQLPEHGVSVRLRDGKVLLTGLKITANVQSFVRKHKQEIIVLLSDQAARDGGRQPQAEPASTTPWALAPPAPASRHPPEELVAWVADRPGPSLREVRDLVEAAAAGTLAPTLEVPGLPKNRDAREFVLDSVDEIRALILAPCTPGDDRDEQQFDALIGEMLELRKRWKGAIEVEPPATGLEDVSLVDADHLADDGFDPFVETEQVPNSQVAVNEAQAERIKTALRCGDPACECHQPDAPVHCPTCERLTLWAGVGLACEVTVHCRKQRYQRRKPCGDEQIWDALEARGLWNQALTRAAQIACRRIWVGPEPDGGGGA